jgi:hypothetical protein
MLSESADSANILCSAAIAVALGGATFLAFVPDSYLPDQLADARRSMKIVCCCDWWRRKKSGTKDTTSDNVEREQFLITREDPSPAPSGTTPTARQPESDGHLTAPPQGAVPGGVDRDSEHFAKACLSPIRSTRTTRFDPDKLPATKMTPALWSVIESGVVPLHLHQRRMRMVFSTDENGYNYAAFRRHCENEEELRWTGEDHAAVMLIWVADIIVGAFLSSLPEWNTKGTRFYTGSAATAVFVLHAEDPHKASIHSSLSEEEGGNAHYIRADNSTLCIGGGGGGAAIRMTDNLTKLKCYAPSVTFRGLEQSLLADPLARGVSGVTKDIDCIVGIVKAVELFAFTDATTHDPLR